MLMEQAAAGEAGDPFLPSIEFARPQRAGHWWGRVGTHDPAGLLAVVAHPQPPVELVAQPTAGAVAQLQAARRDLHTQMPTVIRKAKPTTAIWAVGSPKTQLATPAADKPLTSVRAIGMEQHAAQAPASPSTARIGFFIIFLTCISGNIPVH
jgi:hypothetical protein